jgi:hypothetical protein
MSRSLVSEERNRKVGCLSEASQKRRALCNQELIFSTRLVCFNNWDGKKYVLNGDGDVLLYGIHVIHRLGRYL